MKGDLYTKAQRLVKIDSKCKYPAQIAYNAADTIFTSRMWVCLHSSHITAMWEAMLLFGKSKKDILMWITTSDMLNPCTATKAATSRHWFLYIGSVSVEVVLL